MNNKKLTLIILTALSIFAAYFYLSNNKQTSNNNYPHFAIKDTASITKLKIYKNDQAVELVRQKSFWQVNEKYEAHSTLIELALQTLYKIQIKSPVPKSDTDRINQLLDQNSTTIEVFKKNKLVKILHIGTPTKDSLGTYAKTNNSNLPFILEIPGFYGYLSKRFPADEKAWRTKTVFRIPKQNIRKVELNYPKQQEESFSMHYTNGSVSLYNTNQKKVSNYNSNKANQFLSAFERKTFLSYVDSTSIVNDSKHTTEPFIIISILQDNNTQQTISAYRIPVEGKKDFFGNPILYNTENFYIKTSTHNYVLASYKEFNSILKKRSFFTEQ